MAGFSRRARICALASIAVATALSGSTTAHAALTSPEPDSVQRGDVVITEAVGANVAAPCGSGTSTTVSVTNAAGNVVFSQTRTGSFLGAGAGALTTTWKTADAPNGIYTVKSVAVNRTKTGSFSCSAAAPPVTLSQYTFELRKWQHRFADAAGKGTVYFNTAPKEAQLQLGAKDTGVVPGNGLEVVVLPKDTGPALPSDPAACLADPTQCVPTTPAACTESPDLCEERLALAAIQGGNYRISGLFDLKTGAFLTLAAIGDKTEVLTNVGDACGAIRKKLADRGLDPDTALGGTPVDATLPLELGTPTTIPTTAQALCAFAQAYAVQSLSPVGAGTGVLGTPEVGAGLIIHIAVNSTSGSPTAPSALPYRITRSKTVPAIGALPALPALPAAIAELPLPEMPAGVPTPPSDPAGLVATLAPKGPLTQVKGKGYLSGTHVVGVLNADTAPGPDDANPIWLPLTTAGAKTDSQLDFVGHGTASQDQTCFSLLGTQTCLAVGSVIGTGAAMFGPTPVAIPIIP
ncbi:hypothetical protein [Paraconexibacter sp.]|uniref:hypothetical protein n=1 Tax=Paraconexibacter sp. TaxID=2949640 RepID=UPI00356725B8